MEVTSEISVKDSLLDLLSKPGFAGDNIPDWLDKLRSEATDELQSIALPDLREEEWKYSDMQRILSEFKFSLPNHELQFSIEESNQNSIHLHNGAVVKVELTAQAKDLVTILPIAEAIRKFPELVKKHYGTLVPENDFFTRLNLAYSATGIFLHVKDNAEVSSPIFMFQDCYDEKEMFVQSHNLVLVGKNASVTVIKKQVCSGDGARVFHNLWSEIILEENARFSFHRLQNECKDTFQVTYISSKLAKDAVLNMTNIAIGGSFTRNNFFVDLNGVHSHAKLTGLNILNETQHSDSRVLVKHNVPECESDQMFKSIINDEATAAFSGRIYVARDAQKTNAYQSNKNIVLTETANAYSRPQLEIYADDVKCSHGSTTGQIDEEGLFYLRARGVKESTARKLLLYAFAENIVERLDDDGFREEVHDMIHQKFN